MLFPGYRKKQRQKKVLYMVTKVRFEHSSNMCGSKKRFCRNYFEDLSWVEL